MSNIFRVFLIAGAGVCIAAAAPLATLGAHEAVVDTHAELIPIPPYTRTHGEPGGTAALAAAQVFLDSFDASARAEMMFSLSASERAGWSNLPAGTVRRAGVSVGEMSDAQRALLFDFLSASLSPLGYKNVMDIMAAEAFLSTDRRAQRLMWAPENYWISFYGTPGPDAPWGWQYGGHHLALNVSVEDGSIESASPSFVGTEPAVFTYNGTEYAAVVDMHKAGYGVYLALSAAQKRTADAGNVPDDILTGPGEDGTVPRTIGLRADSMTANQQRLLLRAIEQWVLIQPDENGKPRMEAIKDEIDDTYYAWVGTTEVNTPSYMRIQGPTLVIELLSTGGNVGQSAVGLGHYHTIYRNLANEYGSQ